MSGTATAAFVRVEETLLGSHDLGLAAYFAANAPGLGERAGRLGLLAGAAPALGVLSLHDRRVRRRLAGLAWRGLSRDRLEVLAREYHDRFLGERIRADGLQVLRRARNLGARVVLVSAFPRELLRPLAATVEADDLVGSRLELRDGVATGKLLDGRGEGWTAEYAAREGIALGASYAYGADLDDAPLLRAVGFPCAVNPDRRLRRLAEAEGWPVLEAGREAAPGGVGT